jgi:hypothetical protein
MYGSRLMLSAFYVVVALLAGPAIFTAPARADDDPGFERVFPSVYSDLLLNSKKAYDAKNYDEAFPLMKRAACAGDKESQWTVGHMLLLGQGATRDDLAGYSWIKAAAEFQSTEYRSTAEKIENAIDAKQRPAAVAFAQKYVDAYGTRAARMSCHLSASRQGHIMDHVACMPQQDGQLVMLRLCSAGPAADKPAH